jgi:hypothetical protein
LIGLSADIDQLNAPILGCISLALFSSCSSPNPIAVFNVQPGMNPVRRRY